MPTFGALPSLGFIIQNLQNHEKCNKRYVKKMIRVAKAAMARHRSIKVACWIRLRSLTTTIAALRFVDSAGVGVLSLEALCSLSACFSVCGLRGNRAHFTFLGGAGAALPPADTSLALESPPVALTFLTAAFAKKERISACAGQRRQCRRQTMAGTATLD